ncbi:hypothetical protein BUE76_13820 [Cnuella takakiae]|nr:hypothetical protein BUE76_13820 [Cnuella takakiae]
MDLVFLLCFKLLLFVNEPEAILYKNWMITAFLYLLRICKLFYYCFKKFTFGLYKFPHSLQSRAI